jgi:hypothetical protein
MKKAEYRITIKDDGTAESILTEIDTFFIELERKHPEVTVHG